MNDAWINKKKMLLKLYSIFENLFSVPSLEKMVYK